MQKIIPHLWFDNAAKEAADFYTSVFPDSEVTGTTTLHDTPSGDCDIVSFTVWGYAFKAISAGPVFTINPSVSCMVNFDPTRDKDAKIQMDRIWARLSDGGKVLMEMGTYPFSQWYGWVQDKYGFSWQLILTNPDAETRPRIVPSIMFVGDKCGKAEEASDFYLSVFTDSKRGTISRYPAGMDPDKAGSVMYTDYMLLNQWFISMDSAHKHDFALNEAVSLIVLCEDQKEIDHYWDKLSAVPESEQCGWLKDKYGVSWQIVPKEMDDMMAKGSQKQIDALTQAFLPIKKMDISTLKRAFDEAS